ncbi:MAG: phosphoserine transaminase [Alphaproteobacteria bacterium]|nr:phosphoserine transaminase [Alphaproteobacteria bacterium]
MTLPQPHLKPVCPNFGSGPTRKHPGWNLKSLDKALLGRSHRSIQGKEKLKQVIDLTRSVLQIPADHKIAILAGSATGAIECALWSLLGQRPVDALSFDVFGKHWLADVMEQLRLPDVRPLVAEYGEIPDLATVDSTNDIVFSWNGTTSGTCIPNGDWISDTRHGLTICDATSAAFCFDLPWDKLDAVAFSWQKGLGSEAAHGMLVLSPRALERLETHQPSWPIPRIFRLTKNNVVSDGLFRGETINTPSMLCAEDCLGALCWAESIGGLSGLLQRCSENFSVVRDWVQTTPWISFMAESPEITSPTSVCLTVNNPHETIQGQREFLRTMASKLQENQVALDIVNHIFAPPSLRIWCGPTVEKQDLISLLPWLEWSYAASLKTL